MSRLDKTLVNKISKKIDKNEQYVREQISKRARRETISSEVALVRWAKEIGVPTSTYVRKLPPIQQSQIYSQTTPTSNNAQKLQTLRIVKLGKDENKVYNQLWFQILILGIAVNIASQVIGVLITNSLHLTNP